ncbi:MAG: hypothetical protein HY246_10265 [Proteobacteria bacterium]|nr:hypothetical protein [Pseudomonadota bacterium]
MKALARALAVPAGISLLFVAGLALWLHQRWLQLGDTGRITGYILFAVMLGLGVLNLRKRLSMVPLARAADWVSWHAVGGVLALALFWLHTNTLWPAGPYEQFLALLFYLVTITGIAGYALQKVTPKWLTQTGIELIFERIPIEIVRLRLTAERVVYDCCEATGSETLGRFYLETLDWYFRKPRFLTSTLGGGRRGQRWVRQQCDGVARALQANEISYLETLRQLADAKALADIHYSLQGATKLWLLVHVPLAAAVLVVALWHLLVVSVYAL